MPRIANIATGISCLLRTTYRAIRQRFWILTVTILGICAPAYAMVWWLSLYDNFAVRISVTILVSTLPILPFLSPPVPFRFWSYPTWFALGSILALILLFGVRHELPHVSINATIVFLALPSILAVWLWTRGNWFLITGLSFALSLMMIYWIAALVQHSGPFEILLLPVLVVTPAGAIWALVASSVLDLARRRKYCRIAGPGLQAMAMVTLSFPTVLIAAVIPADLGLSEIWSTVSLALAGILLSAVISEPLRCLLLELGDLRPLQNPT